MSNIFCCRSYVGNNLLFTKSVCFKIDIYLVFLNFSNKYVLQLVSGVSNFTCSQTLTKNSRLNLKAINFNFFKFVHVVSIYKEIQFLQESVNRFCFFNNITYVKKTEILKI